MSHSPEEFTKQIFKRKPNKCPVCGATSIAKILYGMPAPTEDLHKKLEEKKVVLGSCIISEDDPSWCCTECESVFSREG